MNKLFSKIAALSVGLAMAIGVGVAVGSKQVKVVKADETANFTLSGASSVTVDGVTAAFDKNTGGTAPTWYDAGLRLYASNTVTISSSNAITAISFNWEKQGKKDFNTVTADVGSYTHPSSAGVGSWTGSANTIVFTLGSSGQLQLNTFSVTYSSGSTDVLESITVTGSMSKTAYYVGESWSSAGLVATGHYQTAGNKDITDKVTWAYSPVSPALNVTSVVATASIGEVSGSSSAQAVTVSKTNPIQALYTQSSGASVDVYGVYVGFLDGTGPVIMNGAYGMVVYNKTADVSSYTVGETILHVTGSISIYKGLYEIGSATIAEATSVPEESVPETPVVYATKGGETADYASRLTTVTGVPTVTSGSFDSAAGTADIKMNFVVGDNNIQVFYKKAAQTADAEAFAAAKAAVEGSSEITIKGFTGWYDGFQVQMNGYVKPAEDYTAEEFAQDLLSQTEIVCDGWEEGTNNHDALELVWSDLASSDKYPSLPADQKTILANAERDEEGSIIEQAMARYDFLTGKYNLSNFINGRTPIVPAGMIDYANMSSTNNTAIIIIVVATVSALAFTMLLVFKKKKQK